MLNLFTKYITHSPPPGKSLFESVKKNKKKYKNGSSYKRKGKLFYFCGVSKTNIA